MLVTTEHLALDRYDLQGDALTELADTVSGVAVGLLRLDWEHRAAGWQSARFAQPSAELLAALDALALKIGEFRAVFGVAESVKYAGEPHPL